MHRDLKLENFLFSDGTESAQLKAIDFGLSIFFKPVIFNCEVQMADASVSLTRTEFEEQKNLLCELHSRFADMEHQLSEGELLRKKLHNTILELKGNIRVFCRVRPLLPDDGGRHEATVIAYPTSTEA